MEFFLIILAELGAFFQSIYYTLKAWGVGILWLVLGFLLVLLLLRFVLSLTGRMKLCRLLREMCGKAGCSLTMLRPPLRALFSDEEGPDFTFSVGEKTFEVRFCPGFVKGHRAFFTGKGEFRLETFRIIRKKRRVGLSRPEDKNVERVLLFSPSSKGFFEETIVRGEYRDVYNLDNGTVLDGIILFDQKGFLKQTERILEGYVSTYDTRAHDAD